jgi:pyridoxine kinase
MSFDAVYSGYLGSARQLDIVSGIYDALSESGALVITDPVMADDGALYKSFSPDFPVGMRRLCQKADIITPNVTEAALLLGRPYHPGPYTREYVEELLRALIALPRFAAVLTGVYFDDEKLGAGYIERATGRIGYAMAKKIPGAYHGTGDVFASAFTAAYLSGGGMEASLRIAAELTSAAVARSYAAGTDTRFGVEFEPELRRLMPRA